MKRTIRRSGPIGTRSRRPAAKKAKVQVDVARQSTAAPQLGLLKLPEDVLLQILSACTVDDLFVCKKVCKVLERLIRDSMALQYKIELAINGMVDGPPGGLTLSQKLEKLREHHTKLRMGAFSDSGTEYASPAGTLQISATGNFSQEVYPAFGSSISTVNVRRTEKVIDIHDTHEYPDSSQSMRHWNLSFDALSIKHELRSVSVDVGQDLVVIAQCLPGSCALSVSFRTLSRPALAHPDAILPVIQTTLEIQSQFISERMKLSSIQIHGEYIGWVLRVEHSNHYDLEIWNWKSGIRVWHRHFYNELQRWSYGLSFAFLGAFHIIVASAFWEHLPIFRFREHGLGDENGRELQKPVVLLMLPEGSKDVRVHETSTPRPPPSTPFWPDPELEIVTVYFQRLSRFVKKGHANALLLVPFSTLHSIIKWADSQHTAQPTVEWNRWAQRDALLLTPDICDVSMSGFWFLPTWSYGSRVCVLMHRVWEIRGHLLIFDLNPWAAKHALVSPPPTDHVLVDHVRWAEKYKEKLCITHAMLPHTVYHGPLVARGDYRSTDISIVARSNGFTVVMSPNTLTGMQIGDSSKTDYVGPRTYWV